MKILWAKTDFLHPTNRGGQIRTLEMLKRLSARHEVHYVAYDDPESPEGRERAREYAARVVPVSRTIPPRGSPRFYLQLAANLVSDLPLAVGRYASDEMRSTLARAIKDERYDSLVADFLSITPNFPELSECVVFQHNVETAIWERHARHAGSLARRVYFGLQARRMAEYEEYVCRKARHIISVSPADTALMRERFEPRAIDDVPTGVDVEHFRPPAEAPARSGIVFVGAMDWLPNIDGARWFMGEVWPLIRAAHPDVTITFAGRNPDAEIRAFAGGGVRVTGTVPDIRPFLWSAAVSIVPLRIGGGTRLKIYESMAAGAPVVSTAVGAEGLAVTSGVDIAIANDAQKFAGSILKFLTDSAEGQRVSKAALELVTTRFSWDVVTDRFAAILEAARSR